LDKIILNIYEREHCYNIHSAWSVKTKDDIKITQRSNSRWTPRVIEKNEEFNNLYKAYALLDKNKNPLVLNCIRGFFLTFIIY